MLLEKKIAKILTQHQLTLSVAESCSGGLICDRLTNIPGSSKFFDAGIITYSNAAKTRILGVPLALIKKHGAVSAAVCQAMAENVRKLRSTDLGIGVTGIAGPGGGTRQKPIGLVFIAVATKSLTLTKEFHFKGSRLQIKQQTADQALKLLLTCLS